MLLEVLYTRLSLQCIVSRAARMRVLTSMRVSCFRSSKCNGRFCKYFRATTLEDLSHIYFRRMFVIVRKFITVSYIMCLQSGIAPSSSRLSKYHILQIVAPTGEGVFKPNPLSTYENVLQQREGSRYRQLKVSVKFGIAVALISFGELIYCVQCIVKGEQLMLKLRKVGVDRDTYINL